MLWVCLEQMVARNTTYVPRASEIESTWLLHYVTVPEEISDDDEYKGWIEEHTGVSFVANLHEPPAIFIHCRRVASSREYEMTCRTSFNLKEYSRIFMFCSS